MSSPLQFEEPWYFNTFSSLSEVAPLKRDMNVSCVLLAVRGQQSNSHSNGSYCHQVIRFGNMWYYMEMYHSICLSCYLDYMATVATGKTLVVSLVLAEKERVGSRHETIIVSFVVPCLFAYHVNHVADCSCRTMARFDLKCHLLRIVLLFSYGTRKPLEHGRSPTTTLLPQK